MTSTTIERRVATMTVTDPRPRFVRDILGEKIPWSMWKWEIGSKVWNGMGSKVVGGMGEEKEKRFERAGPIFIFPPVFTLLGGFFVFSFNVPLVTPKAALLQWICSRNTLVRRCSCSIEKDREDWSCPFRVSEVFCVGSFPYSDLRRALLRKGHTGSFSYTLEGSVLTRQLQT